MKKVEIKDVKVGDVMLLGGHEVLVGNVHDWKDYRDFEVVDKTTDESGHWRAGYDFKVIIT